MPFLDLNMSWGVRGNLETIVYRKPTHTDKYLVLDSHHPICHKTSVAKTLHRGADCLPSLLDSKAQLQVIQKKKKKLQGFILTLSP